MEACSPGTAGGHFPAERSGSGAPADTSTEISTLLFLSLHRRTLTRVCVQRWLVLGLRNTNGVVEFLRQLVVAGGLSPANMCKYTHTHMWLQGKRNSRNTVTQGLLIQQPCYTHIHIFTNTHFSIPSLFPACLLLCLSLFSLAFSHSSADAFLLLAAGLNACSLPPPNEPMPLALSKHVSPFISLSNCPINPEHVPL